MNRKLLVTAGVVVFLVTTLVLVPTRCRRFSLPVYQTRHIEIVRMGLEEHPYRISDPATVNIVVNAVRVVREPNRPIVWEAPGCRIIFVSPTGRLEVGYVPGGYIVHQGRVYLTGRSFERALQPELDQAETFFRRFGIPYPWSDSNRVFPLDSVATIVDFDTGRRFQVQFLDGDNHADCQTLTAADTRIYKEIYGGVWNWDRRAIILVANGYRLAASMHGKPHGAGSIPHTELPGHFCVHFLGSRTHTGNYLDPDHQQMVLKAAGKRMFGQEIDPRTANSNRGLSGCRDIN